MKQHIFSNLIIKNERQYFHIFNKETSKITIDVIITLPNDIPSENYQKLLLLSTLKIIEPLVRCGMSFDIYSKFDNHAIIKGLVEHNSIDDEIYLYANLNWMKDSMSFVQDENCVDEDIINYFFVNQNTIIINNCTLAEKYEKEISKTLPFAIYERIRANCDYAWRCAECHKGHSGECDAIIYEEYIKTQN